MLGTASWLMTTTANAAPLLITHLAGVVAQTEDGAEINFAQQTYATASSTHTAVDASQHVAGIADLSTGTIKLQTSNEAIDSSRGLGAYGSAFIGDSFRHFSGLDPFVWSGGTEATFTVDIDGYESLTAGDGQVFNFGKVVLLIYQPGTLDDFVPFCGPTVIASFFWGVGPNPADAPCGGAYIDVLEGNVNETLTATFTPGGNFDWAFGITLGGGFNSNLPQGDTSSGLWVNDFFNTATLNYVAPTGATVQSASGLFPGTSPLASVPEPATTSLVAGGLLLLGLVRQRRR